MKKKRFCALALAACLCSAMVPMGASAVAYNVLYDVDRDGTVSITDTIALSQYLMGCYSVADPSVMDVNQNLVVDYVDINLLQAYLVSKATSWEYYDVLG